MKSLIVIVLALICLMSLHAVDYGEFTQAHIIAATGGFIEVKELIDSGADINAADPDGWTVLHMVTDEPGAVKALIAAGADVNVQELKYGATPLHFAVIGGDLGSIIVLIEAGADIHAMDFNGFSPVEFAGMSDDLTPHFIEKWFK